MNNSLWATLNRSLYRARRWYEQTPGRALDQAYDAALMIKAIEDEHFNGQSISPTSSQYSEHTFAYFQTELKKYLKVTELRLSEFKASRSFFNTTDTSASVKIGNSQTSSYLQNSEQAAVVLEKLKFVDAVIDRYRPTESLALAPIVQAENLSSPNSRPLVKGVQNGEQPYTSPATVKRPDGLLDKTGVLPRTIIGTINRIKRDLDPTAEQQVVQTYRTTKARTVVAIRFLLLLIIIPLLTQQLAKTLIVGPIVDRLRPPLAQSSIFINFELEEEALREMTAFRERLEFNKVLGLTPALIGEKSSDRAKEPTETKQSEEKGSAQKESVVEPLTDEERMQVKAKEIAETYYRQGSSSIKNIFADLFSLGAFASVIIFNQRGIAVLKAFIDETVYGLSDSAKAFIIILLTDTFVGFHSPHGWEVLLDSVSRHFGIPSNQAFASVFIATFPVMLDTIFKYWIFRYLNQVSPSAVATYRNMNE